MGRGLGLGLHTNGGITIFYVNTIADMELAINIKTLSNRVNLNCHPPNKFVSPPFVICPASDKRGGDKNEGRRNKAKSVVAPIALGMMDAENQKVNIIPFYILYMTNFLNNVPRYFSNVTSTCEHIYVKDRYRSTKVR